METVSAYVRRWTTKYVHDEAPGAPSRATALLAIADELQALEARRGRALQAAMPDIVRRLADLRFHLPPEIGSAALRAPAPGPNLR